VFRHGNVPPEKQLLGSQGQSVLDERPHRKAARSGGRGRYTHRPRASAPASPAGWPGLLPRRFSLAAATVGKGCPSV